MGFYERNRLRALLTFENAFLTYISLFSLQYTHLSPESGTGKRFQVSVMRAFFILKGRNYR